MLCLCVELSSVIFCNVLYKLKSLMFTNCNSAFSCSFERKEKSKLNKPILIPRLHFHFIPFCWFVKIFNDRDENYNEKQELFHVCVFVWIMLNISVCVCVCVICVCVSLHINLLKLSIAISSLYYTESKKEIQISASQNNTRY